MLQLMTSLAASASFFLRCDDSPLLPIQFTQANHLLEAIGDAARFVDEVS